MFVSGERKYDEGWRYASLFYCCTAILFPEEVILAPWAHFGAPVCPLHPYWAQKGYVLFPEEYFSEPWAHFGTCVCLPHPYWAQKGYVLFPEEVFLAPWAHFGNPVCLPHSYWAQKGYVLFPEEVFLAPWAHFGTCVCPQHCYSSILLQTSPFSLMASSTCGRASKRLREHLMESWKTMMAPGSR